jgi:hypothetical protein
MAQVSIAQQQESSNLEKTVEVSQVHENNDSTSEQHGDFRVVANAGTKDVKLASDGKTVLIPQPSDDPDDVLNWKAGKKYRVLLSLVVASLVGRNFCEDVNISLLFAVDRLRYYVGFGMRLTGVLTTEMRHADSMSHPQVLFEAQAPTFQMSVPAVANSLSGGLFMQGIGGLVAVPLVQRFGRLPVLFWSQLLSAIVVTAAAVSPNYASFTAFRTLQGFVNTPPQVIGLSIVNDL